MTGVEIIEPIQTRDHTERMLKNFGANIEIASEGSKNIIQLASSNHLHAKNYKVVGDISSAAFLIVAALISDSPRTRNYKCWNEPLKNRGITSFAKYGCRY